jgi:hypothetical protein
MILQGFRKVDVAAAFSNKTAPGVSFSKAGNKATMDTIGPFPLISKLTDKELTFKVTYTYYENPYKLL